MGCICETATLNLSANALEEFGRFREKCPALREILVPDNIWPDFKEKANEALGKPDKANHQYILLLAFERNFLRKITSAIHKYLLDNGKPKKELKNQYKKDLQERWMLADNEEERHQRSKIFMGKLTELTIANYLEEHGWKITNLEALCGEVDIEATSTDGKDFIFQVKFIGEYDRFFKERIKAHVRVQPFCPHCINNYIISRVYEAAKQLQNYPEEKIVTIVISSMTWDFVKQKWFNWQVPSFYDCCADWRDYLNDTLVRRYPNITSDLGLIIESINQLWIIKATQFEYTDLKIIL